MRRRKVKRARRLPKLRRRHTVLLALALYIAYALLTPPEVYPTNIRPGREEDVIIVTLQNPTLKPVGGTVVVVRTDMPGRSDVFLETIWSTPFLAPPFLSLDIAMRLNGDVLRGREYDIVLNMGRGDQYFTLVLR